MDRYRYKFLQKPIVSNWPTVPRQLRLALLLTVILTIVGTIIIKIPRNMRIEKILQVQSLMADAFNSEMELIYKNSFSNDDRWIAIDDLDGHVYSAYFDPRPEVVDRYTRHNLKNSITWAVIRIIAILPLKTDEKSVDCIYKYNNVDNEENIRRVRATSVEVMKDHWNLDYSAFFVICDLKVDENFMINASRVHERLPNFVTIGKHENKIVQSNDETKFVKVRYSSRGIVTPYDMEEKFMAICVPVLHHSFDRPLELVEFVEYYRLMGANRFTFYNSSISRNASRVLDYYVINEIATVLKWNLPDNYVYETTLRHEGFYAAINDCLYRNSFDDNYDYVGNFGIDEYVVPRNYENFFQLMNYLDPIVDVANNCASFVFKNVFFYTMYQDDHENKNRNVPYLYTQAKTWRVEEPQPSGDLSRYVVRARDAIELGNYRVHELRQGSYCYYGQFKEVTVDPEVALSHHYSPCEAEETGCYLKPIVMDRTAHRFTEKLGQAVANTCNNVFGNDGCPFVNKQTQP